MKHTYIKKFNNFVNEALDSKFSRNTAADLMKSMEMEIKAILPDWETQYSENEESPVLYVIKDDTEFYIQPSTDSYFKGDEPDLDSEGYNDTVEVFISLSAGSTDDPTEAVKGKPNDYNFEKLSKAVAYKLGQMIVEYVD